MNRTRFTETTSHPDVHKGAIYDLVEDFVVSLLIGGAMAAVLVMVDAPSRTVLATVLGAPAVYFIGQRFRRYRSRKQSVRS
ncbi:hypothetical protein AB4Z18_07170 [Leifsonia sp. 2TAF2]|uniref:hypothetical protein n=1 Tax=Leifsonia sp. 2TAF2 TaxID=3233009 RepID=UPI003F947360